MSRRFRACLNRPGRMVICVLLVALACQIVAVAPASAAGSGSEAVQGLGSFFLTMPYGGIKLAVAVLGALAGGMGFLFTGGDKATADKIWGPSLGGDYVITPEHIRGEKDVHFFGKGPTG